MAKVSREDEQAFLEKVPADGSAVINKALQDLLGWDDEKYFKVRAVLKDKGEIVLGVGRGGRVMRPGPAAENKPQPLEREVKEAVAEQQREADLYEGFRDEIDKWAKYEELPENRFIQITASQGRRATGGVWTRPDLVLVSVGQYLYVPGKALDIITFEVKTRANWNVTAVFEAAAHSRFATKSYLAIEQPQKEQKDPDLERIEEECARFGIGLVYFSLGQAQDTFDVYLDPRRNQPDPSDIERFIKDQIEPANREKLTKWLR